MMIEPQLMLEMVEQRQAYLRSVAARQPSGPIMVAVRHMLGRALIRVGCWIEGRCPDVFAESRTTETWRSLRAADGSH
ncbi:MAG: hypothetical protein M3451_03745 [Chloroflexota bacterium]|jgi:hypothetical protein|nr:hypothetical protein [Chloroflexota bacterium]